MKYLVLFYLITNVFSLFANSIEQKIHRYDWEGIDVVWFEDSRFPTYDIAIYFADGTLSENKSNHGATEMFFNLIDAGTRRYSQKEISDNLEFFGVSLGVNVSHEYSSISFSGLTKDIVPITKKICHLIEDSTFPNDEIDKYKKAKIDGLKSIVANPAALTERVFREVSLGGSPYFYPVSGKISDIKSIKRKTLASRHEYFNKQVKKKIYLTGPKDILKIKDVFINECGWDLANSKFVQENSYKVSNKEKAQIYLVPVENSNQAQVRIGRFLEKNELDKPEAMKLAANFLSGGFTSKLMQELRVKRGLTYSVGAYAGGQKDYGRSFISTFTKNETVGDLLSVTRETLDHLAKKEFSEDELNAAKGLLMGREPFTYEKSSAFLNYILYFDHIGRDLSEMFKFNEFISKITKEELAKELDKVFNWDKQVIVILGDKSLKKQLSSLGKVEIVNYHNFL